MYQETNKFKFLIPCMFFFFSFFPAFGLEDRWPCHWLLFKYWRVSPTADELNMLDVRWPEWMNHHRCSVRSHLMVITNKENKRCTWYSWRFIVLIMIVSCNLHAERDKKNKRTLQVAVAILTLFFLASMSFKNSNPNDDVLNFSSV